MSAQPCSSGRSAAFEPVSLLIDNDTGIDDALALAYLAACEHVEIVSVTSTPGNVDADQVAANNRALLQLCGRGDVPVRIGARAPLVADLVTTPETHGPQGVGYAELPDPAPSAGGTDTGHASDDGAPAAVDAAVDAPVDDAVAHWLDAARARPGELTALLTAPLTNFALALRAEPRLPWLLKSVVIMGGTFYHQGNTTPTAEWNTHVDPHAFKEVFAAYGEAAAAGLPEEQLPVLCPLDVTERFEMQPGLVSQLAAAAGAEAEVVAAEDVEGTRSKSTNPLVRYLSDALRFYFEFHRAYDQGFIAHVHDYFAAGLAAGTLEHRTQLATVDVETDSPLLYGTTVADFRNLWERPANARVVTWNDPAAGFAELVDRLGRLARDVRSR